MPQSGPSAFERDDPPKVSVFMASYNAAAYVEETIRSILGQTWRDLEMIVVDDGSEPPTLDILRRLAAADKRVRLVESAHQGQIGTLNAALALCRGAYVARIDHDDVATPDRLAKQVAYLEAHPNAAAVGSELAFMDGAGVRLKQKRKDPLKRLRHAPLAFPPKQVFLSGSTVTARSEVWLRAGGFRPEFKAAEDRDLCWRLAACGDVVRLPEALIQYRVHDSNLSLTGRRTQLHSQFLASLSAVATELGIDDAAAREKIVVGGDYAPAIEAYRQLIGDRYPVTTYWLYFLARMRMWSLGGYGDGAALLAAIKAHWRARPFDTARIKTLATALRYTRRREAVIAQEV